VCPTPNYFPSLCLNGGCEENIESGWHRPPACRSGRLARNRKEILKTMWSTTYPNGQHATPQTQDASQAFIVPSTTLCHCPSALTVRCRSSTNPTESDQIKVQPMGRPIHRSQHIEVLKFCPMVKPWHHNPSTMSVNVTKCTL
jgi:hypothetical protein